MKSNVESIVFQDESRKNHHTVKPEGILTKGLPALELAIGQPETNISQGRLRQMYFTIEANSIKIDFVI